MKLNYINFTLHIGSSVILNKSFCFILKAEVKEPFKIPMHSESKYSN